MQILVGIKIKPSKLYFSLFSGLQHVGFLHKHYVVEGNEFSNDLLYLFYSEMSICSYKSIVKIVFHCFL